MRLNLSRIIVMVKDEHCGCQHQYRHDAQHDTHINGQEFFHRRRSFHIERIKKLLALR
jgi:hypothetical protein